MRLRLADRTRSTARGHRARLGLRARVTAAFAVGAAVLSAALAWSTYALLHHYLLTQRQTSAISQAYTNARLVRLELKSQSADVADVLASLTPEGSTRSLVYRNGQWLSTSANVGGHSLPSTLTGAVLAGSPAYQRIALSDGPAVAVGVPLPSIGADYFEVRPLTELQTTLDTIAAVLALVAVATAFGGALVGRWASSRLVRPLSEVSKVAGAITTGALDRRLTVPEDADLDPLVHSFNEMVGALQNRIEREARFTSDVSHELRSPLTAVETSVQLLAKFRSNLPPEGHKALDLLSIETTRFSDMVEDLLEISRIDAGAADLALEDIRLGDLVTYAASCALGEPVPVALGPGASDLVVQGDKRRLLRVMANLLDNAHLHAGGAVLVSISRQGGRAEIAVDDAGPGVAPDERLRIFERFCRGRGAGRARRGGGTGLGLALVSEHVRAHGGSVRVDDRPGGGARFTVDLPVAAP